MKEKKQVFNNVLELIGNTPLIKLTKITEGVNPNVEVYAKAEWFNPGGSVKDRPALRMILDGINKGELTDDKILMDSSSGNFETGKKAPSGFFKKTIRSI